MSLVGRESELSIFNKCWQRTLNGARQIVFVTGDRESARLLLLMRFFEE